MLARLQGRLRRPLIKDWQEANPRPYWWSTSGRSSDKLVWIQAAGAEWAATKGFSSGLVLLDLQKAFEHVSHAELLSAAQRTNFPIRQLKLLVELYRSPRVLSLNDAVSQPLVANQAVLPGCHFAT
eukprot:7866304-Pyramimonas_sp.AAC.1